MTYLIKFELYKNDRLNHNIKLVFPTNDRVPGKIEECRGYESRSGLSWEKCYYVSSGKIKEYIGKVRVLYDVLVFKPMTYSDYLKPVERDGKNQVVLTLEQYKKLHKAFLRMVYNILDDNRNLMLFSDSSTAIVSLVKLYDFKVVGRFVGNQANLEIYRLENTNKLKKLLPFTTPEKKLLISSHYLYFNDWVSYIMSGQFSSRRYYIDSAIVHTHNDTNTVEIYHPEHGKEEVKLEPDAYYLVIHVTDRRQAEK